jgi:hypothetical protein
MTEAQVKEILGEPAETKDAPMGWGKIMIWKNGNDTISVTFLNGKAMGTISSWDLPGK